MGRETRRRGGLRGGEEGESGREMRGRDVGRETKRSWTPAGRREAVLLRGWPSRMGKRQGGGRGREKETGGGERRGVVEACIPEPLFSARHYFRQQRLRLVVDGTRSEGAPSAAAAGRRHLALQGGQQLFGLAVAPRAALLWRRPGRLGPGLLLGSICCGGGQGSYREELLLPRGGARALLTRQGRRRRWAARAGSLSPPLLPPRTRGVRPPRASSPLSAPPPPKNIILKRPRGEYKNHTRMVPRAPVHRSKHRPRRQQARKSTVSAAMLLQ